MYVRLGSAASTLLGLRGSVLFATGSRSYAIDFEKDLVVARGRGGVNEYYIKPTS